MSSIAAALRARGANRLVHYGGIIYEIRRVNGDDLMHVGWASLEGAASVREVERQLEVTAKEHRDRINGTPPERQAAAQTEAEAALQALAASKLQAMMNCPEGQAAMLERCTAYVCAAVCRAGRVLDEVTLPAGPLDDGVDLPAIAERVPDSEPARYSEPMRYVRSEKEEQDDAAGDAVWVHRLPPDDRIALGMLIIGVQSVAREVAPFRSAAGAAGAAGRVGAPVQPTPERAPRARSGGRRVQPDGPGGGV